MRATIDFMSEPLFTLTRFDFKIFPGDRIAILGLRGSGKTEFLNPIQDSRVLIFDDALKGKDVRAATVWLNEQSEKAKKENSAVLAVLPSFSWAKRFANRVVGIQNGRIIFDGKVEELNDEIFRKIYVTEVGLKKTLMTSGAVNMVQPTAKAKPRSSAIPFSTGLLVGALIFKALQILGTGL